MARQRSDRAPVWDWAGMREQSERLLVDRTGSGSAEWLRRIAGSGVTSEPELRAWLTERGVTGYGQQLLVFERFGYPDFLLAGADDLIAGQYADRPALRPVLDALLATAAGLSDVEVQARKTYVTLSTPRRKFAQIKATTLIRVEVGLRLPGERPAGRLLSASVLRDDAMTVRIALSAVEDVDDEVVRWLGAARDANA